MGGYRAVGDGGDYLPQSLCPHVAHREYTIQVGFGGLVGVENGQNDAGEIQFIPGGVLGLVCTGDLQLCGGGDIAVCVAELGLIRTQRVIGAVMGLIQVMQNLSDPTKLGAGIAVAFVATVYGLYAANLVLIPFSTKIKTKYAKVFVKKEIIIEGILSIQAGESPALIERKLNAYVVDKHLSNKTATE